MSDSLTRFLFDRHPVRGEFASLDASWLAVLERRSYPPAIRRVLGETLAAAALLSATIKYDGLMTLQIQAKGLLRLLVVQVTAERTLRALARWDESAGRLEQEASIPLADLCGHGTLVLTIEPASGEAYQGIVALDGDSIAEALEAYFERSEQLPTHLCLAADECRAAGLLVQRLPGSDSDADLWNRVEQLSATLGAEELLTLDAATLLRRLFHEEDVRVFEDQPLAFRCTCSRERTGGMLRALAPAEVRELLAEQGEISVDCEFCGQRYRFDAVDVGALLAGTSESGVTRH